MASRNHGFWVAASLVLSMQEQPVSAQTASTTVEDVLTCRAIPTAAERLRCYDTAVAALADVQRSGELIVLDRKTVRDKKAQGFGLRTPRAVSPGDPFGSLQRIDAAIVGVTRFGYDRLHIAVKDHGVWETLEPLRLAPDVGDTLHITRNNFGGFRASVGKGRSVLIKRVR